MNLRKKATHPAHDTKEEQTEVRFSQEQGRHSHGGHLLLSSGGALFAVLASGRGIASSGCGRFRQKNTFTLDVAEAAE